MSSSSLLFDKDRLPACPSLKACVCQPQARMTFALASIGLVATCCGSLFLRSPSTPGTARRPELSGASVLEEEAEAVVEAESAADDLCATYPTFTFKMPYPLSRSNLGNLGPDQGSEGLVYRTIAMGMGGAGSEELGNGTAARRLGHRVPKGFAEASINVEEEAMKHLLKAGGREMTLVVHAADSSGYRPYRSALNGMGGKYGSISIQPGSSVDLEFLFYDVTEYEMRGQEAPPARLPRVALTALDLDEDHGNSSREFIEAEGFEDYRLTGDTKVLVSKASDGVSTRFSASTFGDADDNPKDPMTVTDRQKSRAVTLLYSNVDSVKARVGAGAGTTPREFMFIFAPIVGCNESVDDGLERPLPLIKARGPMQVEMECGQHEFFQTYTSAVGTEAKLGKALVITTTEQGLERTYFAPVAGTVVALHTELRGGDNLDVRLQDRTLAVIEKHYLDPLPRGDSVLGCGPGLHTGMDDYSYFVRFLKRPGDEVRKGEAIAVAKGEDGKEFDLLATTWGTVRARQERLDEDEPIMKVRDMDLMTCEPLKALGPLNDGNEEAGAASKPGLTFVKYHVKVGDVIKTGDAICTVMDGNATEETINATTGGFITALQNLEEGTPLDRVATKTLCTVGKFPPLPLTIGVEAPCLYTQVTKPTSDGGDSAAGVAVVDPAALRFVAYSVTVGDVVEDGTRVCTLKDEDGVEHYVTADRPGEVKYILENMQEGMFVQKVMQGENLCTIGRLPRMAVGRYDRVAEAPVKGDWSFEEWKVQVGDPVRMHQPICVLRNAKDGSTKVVKAAKSGTITARQAHLQKGDVVEQVTKDDALATIGRYAGPTAGLREACAEVPSLDCIFDYWLIHEGDNVFAQDPIALVTCASGDDVRRLAELGGNARRLGAKVVQILAPATGVINYLPDLRPGETIRSQSDSRSIARVAMGTPWWIPLLCALAVLLVCLGVLSKVMEKPRSYGSLPRSEELP